MERLSDDDFVELDRCPWDGDSEENFVFLYEDNFGCDICRCKKCGIVFARKRLNESGLKKYWSDYESRVHVANMDAVKKRARMYRIDYEYIHNYKPAGTVLDVGCGNGDFLDFFKSNGYTTYGVEFGREAAEKAALKHSAWKGALPEFVTEEKFDIVIFRGVLQYFPDVKRYLNKAINLLNDDGVVFITAQPNMDSFCFNLFKENFTQPVTATDFIGYTEKILTSWFKRQGLKKIAETTFYESTPYANLENDILCVADAIEVIRKGGVVDFKSPAFWGNMLTLVYQK